MHHATPAEKLDFRGIQAFDENTAIVMSSGEGDLSRLYKTTDGCRTWTLLLTNSDKGGFWDAIQFIDRKHGFLLGDPIELENDPKLHLYLAETKDGGLNWKAWHNKDTLVVRASTKVFAASNSSMLANRYGVQIGTGGSYRADLIGVGWNGYNFECNCTPLGVPNRVMTLVNPQPIATGDTAGIFSIASDSNGLMLVGGDYREPDSDHETALFLRNGQFRVPPRTTPHGYALP